MIIRPEQMKVFDDFARQQFIADTAEYVRALSPALYAVAGKASVSKVVEQGITRASSYGLTRRGPVQFFIGMVCTLGSGFDSDPQLPWVRETLLDETIPNDLLRADCLYDRLRIYLDKVMGPENEYAIEALDKLTSFFGMAISERDGTASEQVLKAAKDIYPQKLEFVGEAVVRELIRKAEKEARRFELPLFEGTVLLAGLQFAIGHAVCSDPLYPWISNTLADPRTINGVGPVTRLRTRLRLYAQRAGSHLREN